MSSSQNPSHCLESSTCDRTGQDSRSARTLTSHVSQRGSRHDDSTSIARSVVNFYGSRYAEALGDFHRDPTLESFYYLEGSAKSTIVGLGKLSAQERSVADETLDIEAQEGLKLWPVFLAFVHSTEPAETVLEADKLERKEALAKMHKELEYAKDHQYPSYIQSKEDWKMRLVTAVSAAKTSLDDWTYHTLGRFFKLHREYSLNNLVQMDRLMRAAQQGRNKTRRVPRAGRGQGVKKSQKRR